MLPFGTTRLRSSVGVNELKSYCHRAETTCKFFTTNRAHSASGEYRYRYHLTTACRPYSQQHVHLYTEPRALYTLANSHTEKCSPIANYHLATHTQCQSAVSPHLRRPITYLFIYLRQRARIGH